MKKVLLISVLLSLSISLGCATSRPQFVTDYAGQKITISGQLNKSRLIVYINGSTVIDGYILIYQTGFAEGVYEGRKVIAYCYRDLVMNMGKTTSCTIVLGGREIGVLVFNFVELSS